MQSCEDLIYPPHGYVRLRPNRPRANSAGARAVI